MKITQFQDETTVRVALVDKGILRPLDYSGSVVDLIKDATRPPVTDRSLPWGEVRLAPVVTNPSKIIAVGLNYLDHVRESHGDIPETPLVFAKFPNALSAHRDPITWDPAVTSKVDFEAELAVILGKRISRCSEDEAMDAIFGYTCANDVSARDLQFGDGQWVRGKSLDTFCPLGPWIVTADEIPDPHRLGIRCFLNGRRMQESNTDMMIFKLPQLIRFLSQHFTLLPGDVLLTGTPHGVGAFRDPSVYLRAGDEVVVEIDGIGRLVNTCKTL
jgi:2-keto-4-pentenoate hydratase/2-oxohepta-3-ene-1,7-dioic acid hydratase in catechol pathway